MVNDAVEIQGLIHHGRSVDVRSITEDMRNGRPVNPKSVLKVLDHCCETAHVTGHVATHSFRKTFAAKVFERSGKNILAAQSALVSEHCREEIRVHGHDAVYGVYRLLERLGEDYL